MGKQALPLYAAWWGLLVSAVHCQLISSVSAGEVTAAHRPRTPISCLQK